MKRITLLLVFLLVVITSGCGNSDIIHTESSIPDDIEIESVVEVAKNQNEYEETWSYFNLRKEMPSVNWEDYSVLFLGTFESGSCPVIIEEMEVDDENVLSFKYKEYGNCTSDANAITIVMKVERDTIEKVEYVEFQGSKVAIR